MPDGPLSQSPYSALKLAKLTCCQRPIGCIFSKIFVLSTKQLQSFQDTHLIKSELSSSAGIKMVQKVFTPFLKTEKLIFLYENLFTTIHNVPRKKVYISPFSVLEVGNLHVLIARLT